MAANERKKERKEEKEKKETRGEMKVKKEERGLQIKNTQEDKQFSGKKLSRIFIAIIIINICCPFYKTKLRMFDS